MELRWKNFQSYHEILIDNWASDKDKKSLCMEKKSWKETADDIEDCLKYATNGQFRNVVGYIENEPVVAVMFGTECSGKVLKIYNILVSPKHRSKGIAKQTIKTIASDQNVFRLNQTYSKLSIPVLSMWSNFGKSLMDMGLNNVEHHKGYVDLSVNLKTKKVNDFSK